MTAWIAYTASTLALMVALAVGAGWLLGGERADGVWLAAVVATAVQLPAFAALVSSRRKGARAFLVSWGSGMLLRFAVIGGAAFWVTRRTSLDPAVTLVSLVAFIFLLVLLEPVFLGLADERGEATTGGRGRTSED